MNPIFAALAAALIAVGILGYRVHSLEREVAAAVPTCNADKLQTDLDAQKVALEAAEKELVDMRTQGAQAATEAETARQAQQIADQQRATLTQKLIELNHVQEQRPTCRAWLTATVPCDFGL